MNFRPKRTECNAGARFDLVTAASQRQNFVPVWIAASRKQCAYRSGDGSALCSSVTAVSIPSAALAPQQPMRPDSASKQSDAGSSGAFHDQLREAIQQGTTSPGKSGAGDKRDGAKKKDTVSAQPAVTVSAQQPASAQPAPPPASFGPPTAGTAAGAEAEPEAASGEASQDPAATGAIAAQTPQPSANLPASSPAVNTQTPPALLDLATSPEAQPANQPETQLAFALRLADRTPNAKVEQPPVAATQSQPRIETPATGAELAPQARKQPLDIGQSIPQAPSTPASAQVPRQSEQRTPATPADAAQAAQAAVPGIGQTSSHSPEQSGAQTDSNPSRGGSEDPKPARPVSAASGSESGAPPEAPQQTFGSQISSAPMPSPQTTGPAPSAASAPAPVSGAANLAPAEQASAAAPSRPNPTAQVNDISLNVAVPGADAGASGQQVAIRMVQKGEEIHVSVRTPDPQLAQSLRQDLGKLSTSLDQSGFRSESWRPVGAADASAQSNSDPRRDAQPGNPNRDAPGSEARSGGNSGGSQEQRRRQQDDRPRWVAELEQQNNR